ncbi:MAG TPA: PDZ domain-containing protein [Bryobacteraceae bacterium]|nr:PDZ domain-containing protein [Bryobacteraceae bacterium]
MIFACACVASTLAAAGLLYAQTPTEGRLMRFPDIHGNRIVFSYAGDLWLVSSEGGTASRITSDPGLELFPKFSPDGKWIAFTGQYDGNFNVYVMPSEGGQPRQLTFVPDQVEAPERMGPNNEVIAWTRDSRRIVFLSRRQAFNEWFGKLFTVSVDGGLPVALPLDKGGLLAYSPDGSTIAYNRIFRNFRTWKRYKGGMQQDIWTYNFNTKQADRITDYDGTDTFPMWRGDTLYWASDRGPEQRLNLYRRAVNGGPVRQLTDFKDFDVEWPSLGGDSIVFQNGGYLYVLDLKTEKDRKLTIRLDGDSPQARKHWASVAGLIQSFDIAPDGSRAVFGARGDVFTVPAKQGPTRNLTHSSGSREQYVAWSPDGKWIAFVSDETGEQQLYIAPEDGSGKEQQITSADKMFLLKPVWSPDSRKLLYTDNSARLFYVDIQTRQPVLIDRDLFDDPEGYNWAPDSQWVAYGKTGENHNSAIYLYSLADKKITGVTDTSTQSWDPVFDPGGRYLYFLSNRNYNEVLGVFDTEFSNPDATRIYAVTLRKDLPSPVAPRTDEVGQKTDTADPPFGIDSDGLPGRVVDLPVAAGNYTALLANKDVVFYLSQPTNGLSGPLPGQQPRLGAYDLEKRKDGVVVNGATDFALSFHGNKILYAARKSGEPAENDVEQSGPVARNFGVVDADLPAHPHASTDGALNLSDMRTEVDPHEEWLQIFNEVWRQERNYFFEPSMNGVNWEAQREKYLPLVAHAGDRYDLTFILGEMIGELCNSHTYVGGGDYPDLKPVNVGMLGVEFEADPASGRYRFAKIDPGENWQPGLQSPLTEPGLNVHPGDYLLAVNHRELRTPQNPYELLENTAGKETTLTVNSQPTELGARQIPVKPVRSQIGLQELQWIDHNREEVDKMSDGRVGYVYLPDMSAPGLNAFVKQFFPQIRKEGMVIDVRYNGGGFVDQLVFERLRRMLSGMESARNWKSATIPEIVFNGYLDCIANAYTASDGDLFTYFFKMYKLGPVIGERTWGGVRGIRGYIPLIDGGYVTRPEFSLYNLDSQWVVENHGVDPDITVDNRPDLVAQGHDPQLEKAVELVLQDIREHPKALPKRPPDLPAYPKK